MKQIVRFLKYALLLLVCVLIFKIFVPRYYPIPPLKQRENTQFWDLATGSKIGYNLLIAKRNKKPLPIIYLHGGPGGRINDKHIQILSNFTDDGYDVYLYDQIGSGESSRLSNISDYTADRHIKDLHEIIKKIGAQKVILIGQSWGGILATFFAGAFPNEVEKIVLTNPGPLFPYLKVLNEIKPPDSLQLKSPIFSNAQGNDRVKNLRTAAMKFFAIHFGIKIADDKEADEFSTYTAYEINKSTVFDTSKIVKITDVPSISSLNGYYAGIMTVQNLIEGEDRRSKLKGLDIPILVLKSQYDNQIWGGTHEYLELFKNHKLQIIPNAGHFIENEQPELYLKYIRPFLTV